MPQIKNLRWATPGIRLNGGGGGEVYICYSKKLISETVSFMQSGGPAAGISTDTKESRSMQLMGRLYNAFVLGTDGLAVIKIPHANIDKSYERLNREIAAMKAFTHPGLIKLLDNDETDPPMWLVMEFHPGGDLAKRVADYKGKTLESLMAIRPIVEGVTGFHKLGYVHRDIKPKNIFTAKDGSLVLGDFGIVFPPEGEEQHLTTSEQQIISRDWVPDWARFEESPPQPKFDVFMVGKVLYFMITGGRKVLASRFENPKFDIRLLEPHAQGIGEVHDFLSQCITVEEEGCKFEDAAELLKALDRLIENIKGNYHTQLVFSFLSTYSTNNVQIRPYPEGPSPYAELKKIRLFLPQPAARFRAYARVSPPGPAPINLSFRIDGYLSNVILHQDEGETWSNEILLSRPTPLPRGVHTLDVLPSCAGGGELSAFMLYAE